MGLVCTAAAPNHEARSAGAEITALAADPGPAVALRQAASRGSTGHPRLGLAHLDDFGALTPGPKPSLGMPRIHAWVLQKQRWWPNELARMRKVLAAAVAARDRPAPSA